MISRNSPEDFRLTLDAVEPMELLRTTEPMSVSVRIVGPPSRSPAAEQPVEIRGPKAAVLAFVGVNWGDAERSYWEGHSDGVEATIKRFEKLLHATIT